MHSRKRRAGPSIRRMTIRHTLIYRMEERRMIPRKRRAGPSIRRMIIRHSLIYRVIEE
jgi:hypothetical protein